MVNGGGYRGLILSGNFIAPAKGERLRSRGSVIKGGKRQVVVRADVWSKSDDATPVLVAIAQTAIVPTGISHPKKLADVRAFSVHSATSAIHTLAILTAGNSLVGVREDRNMTEMSHLGSHCRLSMF